jgi:hypothetical protein
MRTACDKAGKRIDRPESRAYGTRGRSEECAGAVNLPLGSSGMIAPTAIRAHRNCQHYAPTGYSGRPTNRALITNRHKFESHRLQSPGMIAGVSLIVPG